MAQRYTGTHSPGASASKMPRPQKASKALGYGVRMTLLSAVPLVLGMRSIFQGASGLALGLGAAAIMGLSLWLLRDGLKAQAAYEARSVANRPAIPRKIFAAVLWGIGLAGAVLVSGQVTAAALMGLIGTALFIASFGIDPLQAKGMDKVDERQFDRASRAIDQGRAALAEMRSLIAPLRARDLQDKLAQFTATAETLFERIYHDPRDLTSARRYLTLYLEGARDAARQFAVLYAAKPTDTAKADFIALLTDLDQNFARKTESLIENDTQDLSIELDVLRDRLARERH